MGRERKRMGEPGHDDGNCGHLSQHMLEWGFGQFNGVMGKSRVIPVPLSATAWAGAPSSLHQNPPRQRKKYKITLSAGKKKNPWIVWTGAEIVADCRALFKAHRDTARTCPKGTVMPGPRSSPGSYPWLGNVDFL